MSDVLKPCPFCGGEAHKVGPFKDDWVPTWIISCGDCAAATRADTSAEAIIRWNRRTIPTIPVLGKIGDERPASIADHSSDH